MNGYAGIGMTTPAMNPVALNDLGVEILKELSQSEALADAIEGKLHGAIPSCCKENSKESGLEEKMHTIFNTLQALNVTLQRISTAL